MTKSLLTFPIILSIMTFAQTRDSGPGTISPQARAIHESAIIVDTHADTPQRFLDEGFDLATNTNPHDGHEDFGKIKQGGIRAQMGPASCWDGLQVRMTDMAERDAKILETIVTSDAIVRLVISDVSPNDLQKPSATQNFYG